MIRPAPVVAAAEVDVGNGHRGRGALAGVCTLHRAEPVVTWGAPASTLITSVLPAARVGVAGGAHQVDHDARAVAGLGRGHGFGGSAADDDSPLRQAAARIGQVDGDPRRAVRREGLDVADRSENCSVMSTLPPAAAA
jgi:hypothetical protein